MLKVGSASDEDFDTVEVDKVVSLDELELDPVAVDCELDVPVELPPVDLELEPVVVASLEDQVTYGSLLSAIACARADCCTSYQEVMPVAPARNSSKLTVPV